MSRKLLILISLGGFLSLVLLIAILADLTSTLSGIVRGESFYRRRPTGYWQRVIAADGADGQLQQATIEAFGNNRQAVSVLRECLQHRDADVRWPSILLFQQCASLNEQKAEFLRLLDDPVEQVRVESIYSLGRLRREALPALPRLRELAHFEDSDVATAARHALWGIDGKAAREAEGWALFHSEEWQFSAHFPGSVNRDSRRAKDFDSDLHEYWAWSGSSRFTVALSFALPDPALTENERYDLAARLSADALNGNLERNDRIEQHGVPGREQKILTELATIQTRMLVVGDRVYRAHVAYQPELLHSDAIEYFLDSFAIMWRPEDEPQE